MKTPKAPKTPLTDERLQALHGQLEERARQLREEVRAVGDELAEAPARQQHEAVDAGDQSEQTSRDEVRTAERLRDAAELNEIAAALDRMDRGRYGTCIDCGTAIPLERLQVQAAASRCITCQGLFEQMQTPTPAA